MNTFRKIAEKISRGRILKRKIDAEHGSFLVYVSPDAQLKYLKFGNKNFDQDLIKIADNLVNENDVIWDVGANVGIFTFACAFKSKTTVLSIEADIWLCSVLERTSRLPNYAGKDLRILPVAASAADGVDEFIIAARGRASNALASAGGRSQMGGARFRALVPTLCLDTIAETQPRPDFIKIDVEGAELDVLKGAIKLIRSKHPTFYVEVGAGVFDKICEYMSSHSYLLYDESGNLCKKKSGLNYFFVHQDNWHFRDLLAKFNKLRQIS